MRWISWPSRSAEQVAAVPQHQAEQPDDPYPRRLVCEHRLELSKIDLRLLAGGGLDARSREAAADARRASGR
jgi:hypothetical protein